jgi:hypothetical protein
MKKIFRIGDFWQTKPINTTTKNLNLTTPLVMGLVALLLTAALANAATLFQADFNAAENLTNPADLPGLLNPTTSTGSWSNFVQTDPVTTYGIMQNATADNGALTLDLSDNATLRGNLSSATSFASDALTFSWDTYAIRTGAAKDMEVNFYDSSDNLVYGINWIPDGIDANNRLQETVDGTFANFPTALLMPTSSRVGGGAVAGSYDPSKVADMTVVFDGTSVTVNDNTSSTLTLGGTDVAYFELGLAGGNSGAVYDNFLVTTVPEPSAAALLVLCGFGLIGFGRRRKR